MRRPVNNDRHMCESRAGPSSLPGTQIASGTHTHPGLAGIAFQIMKDLGVSAMDDPATVVFPEQGSLEHWISAECHRRTFWILYVVESLSSAFTTRPMTFKDSQLKVRLPIDEASFELGLRKDGQPGASLVPDLDPTLIWARDPDSESTRFSPDCL